MSNVYHQCYVSERTYDFIVRNPANRSTVSHIITETRHSNTITVVVKVEEVASDNKNAVAGITTEKTAKAAISAVLDFCHW